jgi:mono/diheme cytochrome c family protein
MPTRTFLAIPGALLLAALLGACTPNPQPAGLTPIPTLATTEAATLVPPLQGTPATSGTPQGGQTEAAQGAPIFQQYCASCHGSQAEGGIGPALTNNRFIQTSGDQAIATTIAQGRPGTLMPAWSQANGGPLTDAQIASVVAFLHTLQGQGSASSPTAQAAGATPTHSEAEETEEEPALPSNPGGPGPAVSLIGDASQGEALFADNCATCHGPSGTKGILNPGAADGDVPPVNPIDPMIASSDPKVFAANVDLFIEHGSTPEGSNPEIDMPDFGDSQTLTAQQIADLIAYIMQLNGVQQK